MIRYRNLLLSEDLAVTIIPTPSRLPSTPPTAVRRPSRAGMMVPFPSNLPHTAFPHQGARQRISIAFNLRKEPFP
jgi:hypothetical protein